MYQASLLVGCLFVKVPVFTNAIGGILVGLVTTAAGGVRKVNIRILFQLNLLLNFSY